MGLTGSGGECPVQARRRMAAIRERIEAARLKIEGLALLGDMLAENVRAIEARCDADRPAAQGAAPCGRPRCAPPACAEAQCADGLEQAFDRLAERVAALHCQIEFHRRERARPRRRRPPPPPSRQITASRKYPTA